jgi:regulatory protein YycI of two-component signal transduction system YycFG
MTHPTLNDPRDTVAEHLKALKAYVKKNLVHGEELTEAEKADKSTRLVEFVAIGDSFRLTEKEMVQLIFRDMLREPKQCGCPSCRARINETKSA